MTKLFGVCIALVAMAVSTSVSASCTTSSPINAGVAINALTDIHNGGDWDGTYNLQGSAVCPDTQDETLAVSAALASPAWLGDKENFSLSGGLGFADGETAVGATGIVRIDQHFSAFAGGAVSTGGDTWAGKAGVRVGW